MSLPFKLNQIELPTMATIATYPALSVGLCIFTFLALLVDTYFGTAISHAVSLYPYAPAHFDMNRLSMYLLFHQGLFHWLFNIIALFTPLAMFERAHGTVYTGITLNLLAVVAGLQYCILGVFLYPETHVIGLSGVVFSFMSFYAYKEHQVQPVLYTFKFQGREHSIPTLYSPIFFLFVTSILLPGSSFFGHLAGMSTGYLLAMDYLRILYPPSKVVLFIEKKLSTPISCLQSVVTYYTEAEAVEFRGVSYNPILSQGPETA